MPNQQFQSIKSWMHTSATLVLYTRFFEGEQFKITRAGQMNRVCVNFYRSIVLQIYDLFYVFRLAMSVSV